MSGRASLLGARWSSRADLGNAERREAWQRPRLPGLFGFRLRFRASPIGTIATLLRTSCTGERVRARARARLRVGRDGIPATYGPSYPQFRARPAEIKRSVKISLPSPGERSKYRPPTAARRNDSPPRGWSPAWQPDGSALNSRIDGTAGVRPSQMATSQRGRSNGPPDQADQGRDRNFPDNPR